MRRYLVIFAAIPLLPGCSDKPSPKPVPPSIVHSLDVLEAKKVAAKFLDAAKTGPNSGQTRQYLSEAYQDRWHTPSPEPIRHYHYSAWQLDDPTTDPDARTVTFPGRTAVTEFVERRDITATGWSSDIFATGGEAGFTLVMKPGADGAWQVDDFRFAPRTPRAGIADIADSDLDSALGGILRFPQPVIDGRSKKELAEELSASIWPIWYSGGPVQIGISIEETGQETVSTKGAVFGSAKTLTCNPAEGRIAISTRRWLSERMKQIFLRVGKEGSTQGVAISVNGYLSNSSTSVGFPFLWFHWKQVSFTEVKSTPELQVGVAQPVLVFTAKETGVAEGTQPRQVKLTLSVTKLPKK